MDIVSVRYKNQGYQDYYEQKMSITVSAVVNGQPSTSNISSHKDLKVPTKENENSVNLHRNMSSQKNERTVCDRRR
jgi:hypothetical protein